MASGNELVKYLYMKLKWKYGPPAIYFIVSFLVLLVLSLVIAPLTIGTADPGGQPIIPDSDPGGQPIIPDS